MPERADSSLSERQVCQLVDGERFRWDDRVWEADVKFGHVTAYLEGGFGSRVTFYDPVTAAKAGELSWTTLVEPL